MNKYVFDTGPLIDLFKHYYPKRFPTLWKDFDVLVKNGHLMSVREVSNEINLRDGTLKDWTKNNKDLFTHSIVPELQIVTDIFKEKHYQFIIRKQERLKGRPIADPFVVARAKYLNAYVVTTEKYTDENAAKLPNICDYLEVEYINLEQFMELEGWTF